MPTQQSQSVTTREINQSCCQVVMFQQRGVAGRTRVFFVQILKKKNIFLEWETVKE
jgi:hypothetical protein